MVLFLYCECGLAIINKYCQFDYYCNGNFSFHGSNTEKNKNVVFAI